MICIRSLRGATGVVLAFLATVSGTASGQEPAAPAAPEHEKPSSERSVAAPAATATAPAKPRLSAHVYEEESTAPAAERVEAALGEVLASDQRLEYKPFAGLLEPTEDVPRLLGEADIAVVDADQAFSEMDLEKAKKVLQSAIDTYQKLMPQLAGRGGGVTPLRDAYIRLAKTRFFDGDNDGARDALRYVWVLDPTMAYSPRAFPPQMKKTVVEAKLLFQTLGPGKLTIDSDPQGAEVWLNGEKLAKLTPTEAQAQPGPNLVSFHHRGYAAITTKFEVNGENDTSTAMQGLERHVNNPIGGINRARLHLDEAKLPAQLRESVKALDLDLLFLLRFAKQDQSDGSVKMKLSAYLYDARPDRVIKKGERIVPEPEVPAASRDLTRELTHDVRLDGIWVPPPPPPRSPSKSSQWLSSFRHSNVFWYVVGGVAGAAVIATAVGVGVAEERRHSAANAVVLFGGH